jgi:hypothetical protein
MNTLHESTKKLIDTLKSINLPKGKFVIFGSGAMLIRGLKEGHDLDIFVTHDLFEEFKNREGWKLKPCNEDFYLSHDGIELWETWRPGVWSVQELIDSAEYIEGLPFVSLETTLKWKEMNGREKDLAHVQIIKEYLSKQQA